MGDSPTTQRVWDEFGRSLHGFFARRLADAHTADDLTQEALLRVHRGLPGLADAQRVGPWVFRIARNVLTDHLRKRKPPLPIDGENEIAAAVPRDEERDRLGRCLRSMLTGLPPDYRQAVEAVEIDGTPQVSYARQAGLSVSGAKSRVQRGRRMLKDALLTCCQVEFDRLGVPVSAVNARCRHGCGCADEPA